MLNCIVVDDEPLGRECITNYIEQVDFLNCIGTCTNALEIRKFLENEVIDLIFLDIQMPVMNGLEFLKLTVDSPMTILTTAYPNYAIEGFDLDVVDYLLKPITFNRFFIAANKAQKKYLLLNNKTKENLDTSNDDCFFIRCNGKYEKIFFDDILFVEAMQNYVIIQTVLRKYVSHLYLKNVEEKLKPHKFLRVHKSYIVAISKIDSIENHEIKIQSYKIPLSRNYKKEVLPIIFGDKLWGNTSS